MFDGYDISSVIIVGFIIEGMSALISLFAFGLNAYAVLQIIGMIATTIAWIYADHKEQLNEFTPEERMFYEAWK